MATENEQILARLDVIGQQIGALAERQRFFEELVEEMTPVALLAMNSAIARLDELDKRGVFEMFTVMLDALNRVIDGYTPDDAQHLADAVVGILDTVRNVTQPGVLQIANEATDVLRHADGVKPIGMFGVMRKATSDKEIQRGIGVMLELMRAVGRVRDGASNDAPRSPAPKRDSAARQPVAAETAPRTPAEAPEPKAAPAAAPAAGPAEVVQWEGHDFTSEGFLVDPNAWTPELAGKIAGGLGIELTDEHMHVIEWVRDDYSSSGASPNVRRVATGSGAGTQAMYTLFPPSPGKTCAMIAGVPKPVGCV